MYMHILLRALLLHINHQSIKFLFKNNLYMAGLDLGAFYLGLKGIRGLLVWYFLGT